MAVALRRLCKRAQVQLKTGLQLLLPASLVNISFSADSSIFSEATSVAWHRTMSALLKKAVINRVGQNDGDLIVPLAERLWGLSVRKSSKEAILLIEFYNAKTAILDPARFCPTSHNDLVNLVSLLKTRSGTSLKDLPSEVLANQHKHAWLAGRSNEAVLAAMKFAASIWLMSSTSGWSEDEILSEFIQRNRPSCTFSTSATNASEIQVTARGLSQIAGIDILWTSDLREHLKYNPRQRILSLFRHGSFLKERSNSGYPQGFLQETASTMALLFPYGDSPHKRWNRRIRRKAEPDVEVGLATNPSRDPQDYQYWGGHLISIQKTFDTSKPGTLRQWIHDTRDGNQFYTFWFAVFAIFLTLLFGLIQSVTGILQVIKD